DSPWVANAQVYHHLGRAAVLLSVSSYRPGVRGGGGGAECRFVTNLRECPRFPAGRQLPWRRGSTSFARRARLVACTSPPGVQLILAPGPIAQSVRAPGS